MSNIKTSERPGATQKVQRKRERPRLRKKFTKPSLTKQSFKNECDINKIMDAYQASGVLTHVKQFQGNYGDFSNNPGSYHEAMNQVVKAQTMFLTLPSNIRKRFDNDPGQFLDFISDPSNEAEMFALGLIPPIADKPSAAPVAAPSAKPSDAPAPDGSQTPIEAHITSKTTPSA